MYRIPEKIKKGDTIGVISPASRPLNEEKLFNGMKYLKQQGFHVVPGKHVLNQYGYLAGTDAERAEDVNQMFADPQIDAVFCTRGGYGCSRILNRLDYEMIRQNPKALVGYSDITALQHALLSHSNLITFSGPMVAVEMSEGIDEDTEEHFWAILMGTELGLSGKMEKSFSVFKHGIAEGPIIAGCLSVLVTMLGTPYSADFTNAILFIEDIAEEPYKIDRNLSHLKAAGIFNQVQGLVFSQFISCENQNSNKKSLTIQEIINDLFHDLDIPIILNYSYGHGSKKYTIPFGANSRLNTYQNKLEILRQDVL